MKSLGNITTEFKSAKKRPTGIINLPASGLRATISLKEIANDKHPVTFAVHDHRTKESYRRLLTGNKHRWVDSNTLGCRTPCSNKRHRPNTRPWCLCTSIHYRNVLTNKLIKFTMAVVTAYSAFWPTHSNDQRDLNLTTSCRRSP